MEYYNDSDVNETREWREAFHSIFESNSRERAEFLLDVLYEMAMAQGLSLNRLTTPYVNSIPEEYEPAFLGNVAIEKKLHLIMQYNLLVLMIRSNKNQEQISRELSSIVPSLNLYDIGLNHFFRAKSDEFSGDSILYPPQTNGYIYARYFLEGRISAVQLARIAQNQRTSSDKQPHQVVFNKNQFPVESIGVTPIMSIYHARMQKYLIKRGLMEEENRRIWAFFDDKKITNPHSLGAIPLASKERLSNLIWVVSCTMQKLNHTAHSNANVIQDLESTFRAAGWQVVKVVWSSNWDILLRHDVKGALRQRIMELTDSEYQLYLNQDGSFIRKNFFGKYKELNFLAKKLSDNQMKKLFNEGNDPVKIYSAYSRAVKNTRQPTVVLVKSVVDYGKNYGLIGSHEKQLTNQQLLMSLRDRIGLPLTDKQLKSLPFYRPDSNSAEMRYLQALRQSLGGFMHDEQEDDYKKGENLLKILPQKTNKRLKLPNLSRFNRILQGSQGKAESMTTVMIKAMALLLRENQISNRIMPIISDETHSSGFEKMLRRYGIYAAYYQTYKKDNSNNNPRYDYHSIDETVNEVNAMSSWNAAATSYYTNQVTMIPMYLHCSLFGYQRMADLVISASKSEAKGFLFETAAEDTTVNSLHNVNREGSHFLFGAATNCVSYNPCYAYELAIIIHDGLYRMYAKDEKIHYYINLTKEEYEHPAIVSDCVKGIKKGMYLLENNNGIHLQLLGTGATLVEVRKAATILKEMFEIDANVWSVTSFNELAKDGMACDEFNMRNPLDEPKVAWIHEQLARYQGIIIGATDHVRSYAEQIRGWIPEGCVYTTLGKDGVDRNDCTDQLRSEYRVDAANIVVSTLNTLAELGHINVLLVMKALKFFNLDSGLESKDKAPQSKNSYNAAKHNTNRAQSRYYAQFKKIKK